MISDPIAAKQALLVMYAENMYDRLVDDDKNNLSPPVDPKLAPDWDIVGFITAEDALADAQRIGIGTRFYYGFLAQSIANRNDFIVVIRGTANASEWIEDIEFLPVDAPTNMSKHGHVENGFFSIYQTMRFSSVGDPTLYPVVDGIVGKVGSSRLTILGHSLGSALATYLSLDLALSAFSGNLAVCLFASPHAADRRFGADYDEKVSDYKVYNYSRDIVPKVPMFFEYAALPRVCEFSADEAQAEIQNTLAGNHHVVCYAAMLDYTAADWTEVPHIDEECAKCIKGPNSLIARD